MNTFGHARDLDYSILYSTEYSSGKKRDQRSLTSEHECQLFVAWR